MKKHLLSIVLLSMISLLFSIDATAQYQSNDSTIEPAPKSIRGVKSTPIIEQREVEKFDHIEEPKVVSVKESKKEIKESKKDSIKKTIKYSETTKSKNEIKEYTSLRYVNHIDFSSNNQVVFYLDPSMTVEDVEKFTNSHF